MISLLAAAVVATNMLVSSEIPLLNAGGEFALPTNATPAQFVACARAMIPREVRVEGKITVKNRRGMVQGEHDYVLARTNGVNSLIVDGKRLSLPAQSDSPIPQPILDTEVTMSDLTLDYLEWDDISFAGDGEEEAVHIAIKCKVVVLKKDGRQIRIWVDRKTGAMVQAEESLEGSPVRLMWGSRIKKFDGRWAPSQMCVEKPGSGRRTFITVENMQ